MEVLVVVNEMFWMVLFCTDDAVVVPTVRYNPLKTRVVAALRV